MSEKTKMTDKQVRDLALANYQSEQATKPAEDKKREFPTEIFELPSKGKLYPEGHPLREGSIELRYMTAADEDILATDSYIKKGIVFDKLFEAIIVTPFNYGDLLLCDKDAIMIATRILSGYGTTYKVDVPGKESKLEVDLTKLEDKPLHEIVEKAEGNSFTFELPISKSTIVFKLLTHADDAALREKAKFAEAQAKRKGLKNTGKKTDMTDRLKAMIISIDGNSEPLFISSFVNKMLAGDSRAFRQNAAEISPGVNYEVEYIDDNDEPQYSDFRIDIDFLYPGA